MGARKVVRILGFAVAIAAVPAALATRPVARADVPVAKTLYLHSLTPAGSVEGALPTAGMPGGPFMDETAPSSPSPKVANPGPGNEDFRKNPFLAWWAAPMHGNVSNGSVTLWASGGQSPTVSVTIFGDGGVSLGGAIAHESRALDGRAPQMVTIDFPTLDGAVNAEIVVSVAIGLGGGSVLYDATLTPSAFSFDLGPYVPPPPPVLPPAAAGWEAPTIVSADQAHRESSLALSPTNPSLMLICDPSGTPNTEHGQSYFHRSTDGGTTWSPMNVETSDYDTRKLAFEGGDCDVAFDRAGTAYSADTWLGDLSVGHSTDGGNTWSGTAIAVTSPIVDRPWLAGGAPGVIHITYQDLMCCLPSAMWYTRSTDSGTTFRPAVPITTAGPEGTFTWQGNVVASPDDNDLYLVYTRRAGPLLTDPDAGGPETVWVAASHNGGLTWTSHLVASMPNPASYLFSSIAMDAAGYLHVVFASRTSQDRPIWYAFSSDGAETWSAPVKLLAGAAGYSPWVAGAAAGQAAIAWYGSPNPRTTATTNADWYFYWARVTGAETGTPQITTGTTTTAPIFTGQSAIPEFNMVRLDAAGKMHIGASAYFDAGRGTGWTVFYQRET